MSLIFNLKLKVHCRIIFLEQFADDNLLDGLNQKCNFIPFT